MTCRSDGQPVGADAFEPLPHTEAELSQRKRTWHSQPEYRLEARDRRRFPSPIRCFGMSMGGFSPIGEDKAIQSRYWSRSFDAIQRGCSRGSDGDGGPLELCRRLNELSCHLLEPGNHVLLRPRLAQP